MTQCIKAYFQCQRDAISNSIKKMTVSLFVTSADLGQVYTTGRGGRGEAVGRMQCAPPSGLLYRSVPPTGESSGAVVAFGMCEPCNRTAPTSHRGTEKSLEKIFKCESLKKQKNQNEKHKHNVII